MSRYSRGPSLVFSLRALCSRLVWSPVKVSQIAGLFEDVSLYGDFRQLTLTYLPEKAEEIFAKPYAGRPSAFIEFFSDKYFPLWDTWNDEGAYRHLMWSMPFETFGYDPDNASAPCDMALEVVLAHSLIENSMGENNEHLDWLKAQDFGPDGPNQIDIARAHPRRSEELKKVLEGTAYAFLAEFAAWTWWDTGNGLLDFYDEGGAQFPSWSDEEVQGGIQAFAECKEFWERESKFFAWLKEDPRGHYHELVEAIESKLAPPAKTDQLALWEGIPC